MDTNPDEYTPKELALKERNEAQKSLIESWKKWDCKMLGVEEISDQQLGLLFFHIGFFPFYGGLWELSQEGLNPYYTSLKVQHWPRPTECLDHLLEYYRSLEEKEPPST